MMLLVRLIEHDIFCDRRFCVTPLPVMKHCSKKDCSAHTGEQYRPAKRTLMEGLCRMKKRKGWSATKVGGRRAQRSIMMAAVAAAASVPSSFTSTKALWTTFDNTRSLAGDMPDSKGEKEEHLKQL